MRIEVSDDDDPENTKRILNKRETQPLGSDDAANTPNMKKSSRNTMGPAFTTYAQDAEIVSKNLNRDTNIQNTDSKNEAQSDNKYTVRTEAYAYAKKLAMSKKITVNVVEKDGYWLVESKKP